MIARSVKGKLEGGSPEAQVCGVSTDSRTIRRGELFVALRGERFDGHNFVSAAFRNGAAAALVHTTLTLGKLPPQAALVVVEDTTVALAALAAAHRRAHPRVWIGVTGSAGKSTTKEMIAHCLGSKYAVHKSSASFNNHIGVPLSVLGIEPHHEVGVIELGTNHPGEIAALSEVVKPDLAVITGSGPAHLEGLGDLEGVRREKGAILDGQGPRDVAVLNADDEGFPQWRSRARGRVVTFGRSERADFRARRLTLGRSGVCFDLNGTRLRVPGCGVHNIPCALAAAAACRVLGLPLAAFAAALARYRTLPLRMELLQSGGLTLIADCYNASPASFTTGLLSLPFLGRTGRLVVCCGTMKELGEEAPRQHLLLGTQIAASGAQALFVIGEHAEHVATGALLGGLPMGAIEIFYSTDRAIQQVPEKLRDGDLVLVKGSRALRLEALVAAIRQRGEGPAEAALRAAG